MAALGTRGAARRRAAAHRSEKVDERFVVGGLRREARARAVSDQEFAEIIVISDKEFAETCDARREPARCANDVRGSEAQKKAQRCGAPRWIAEAKRRKAPNATYQTYSGLLITLIT